METREIILEIKVKANVIYSTEGVEKVGKVELDMGALPKELVKDKSNIPDENGNMIVSLVLCAGIANNIHGSEQYNKFPSPDHLRLVIENLEQMTFTPMNITATKTEKKS